MRVSVKPGTLFLYPGRCFGVKVGSGMEVRFGVLLWAYMCSTRASILKQWTVMTKGMQGKRFRRVVNRL